MKGAELSSPPPPPFFSFFWSFIPDLFWLKISWCKYNSATINHLLVYLHFSLSLSDFSTLQSITCLFFYTSIYYLLVLFFLHFHLLLACFSTHQSKPWKQTDLQQFGSKKMNSLEILKTARQPKGQSSPSYQHSEDTGLKRSKLQLIRKRESQKFLVTTKSGTQTFQLTPKRKIPKFPLTGQKKKFRKPQNQDNSIKNDNLQMIRNHIVNKTITPEKSKLQKLCWHHRE